MTAIIEVDTTLWKEKIVLDLKKVLVKLFAVVNKDRRVTLKYFSILIKIDKEHRLFMSRKGPESC